MKTLLVLFGLSLALYYSTHAGNSSGQDAKRKKNLAELVHSLRSGNIKQVDIIYFPASILTRTQLTPEMLEKQWKYKLTIREFDAAPSRTSLISALEASILEETAEEGDLRWGCSFYNDKNERVLSLYFDATGKHGSVGNQSVTANGKFVKILKEISAGFPN